MMEKTVCGRGDLFNGLVRFRWTRVKRQMVCGTA